MKNRKNQKQKKYHIFLIIIILCMVAICISIYLTNLRKGKLNVDIASLKNVDLETNYIAGLDTRNFAIEIRKDNKAKYSSQNSNAIVLYNTVMVPMDEIFSEIFGESYKKGTEQELKYNNTTLNIKENCISVPNITTGKDLDKESFTEIDKKNITDDTIIDNSVDVEIEEIEGIKYIPLYLISNIDGVSVSIDNRILYLSKEDEYYNSISAIDTNKDVSSIIINLDYKDKENIKTKYLGQELGALWREEAYKRIEKYRKNDVSIVVKKENGEVVNNAKVKISMKKNDFKFGTSIRYLVNQRK